VGILLEQEELAPDLLLNVNVPIGEISGVSFTKLGRRVYKQSVVEKTDPRGRKYYWIAGTPQWHAASGTDFEAISNGRISVTPLHLDLTHYPGLESFGPLREKLDRLSFPLPDSPG
jgi:5'-nucleotidase